MDSGRTGFSSGQAARGKMTALVSVNATPELEVPVLIVGGSLVGLTTAMLLGHHGVPALSVERHAGTAIHPRAGHF